MFEVTGDDIANLSDSDLRTLVARLALAELREQGCPLSSVTASGNQDAADGGLDVRVECPISFQRPDFVPRMFTGFQVKKPDMPPSAICAEMSPKGVLRPVIRELAAASGAYIIVSAQGSVADKPLSNRRAEMRKQLNSFDDGKKLYTDFYDRERVATWSNEYPGIIAWVRSRLGRMSHGWSSIGDWAGITVAEPTPYLFNDKACLTDERTFKREQLTIAEGVSRLRDLLRSPKQCVRLIGLSGLGKTRLVQALFESGVGENPLDPNVAVYTDYSEETNPTARDMARNLIARGQRAILIVDNCNPATHSELTRICCHEVSNISLLTVEYDVSDDEPEQTEVFRLQSAAPELVALWLEQSFPNVSQVDRRTIADFSDGNFRIARAIAETLRRGETLGKLKSRELFNRIFLQRNNPDQALLHAAEDLALLYSIDGDDTSDSSELALIGTLHGVSAQSFYGAIHTLRSRGIVQTRGRWRAILPHAIANPLAGSALDRIPPADFDRFCSSLTPRMQRSLSRRLGYLHDNKNALTAVLRWLRPDGPLGNLLEQGQNGFDTITNISPVAPETVLKIIEDEVSGPHGDAILSLNAGNRWQWTHLIKVLGYEPEMFERAAVLLARFVSVEPEGHRQNSAREPFAELFHLYLSGTKAGPQQRRDVVGRLARSSDLAERKCALIALGGLLRVHHFSSTSAFGFGARSRDLGWIPQINEDVWNWYNSAIILAVELSQIVESARQVLANSVRSLWGINACRDALDDAATTMIKEKPWIEGWLGFRAAHRYEGNAMPADVRLRLEGIIQRLKPVDLLHQARAVILDRTAHGWDIVDGESDEGDAITPWQKATQMAQTLGRSLAQDAETRAQFLPELFVVQAAQRAFDCGLGLAGGTDDLVALWNELGLYFGSANPRKRNPTVLGGFISEANRKNPGIAVSALEAVINNPALKSYLPYLQAQVGINEEGIARLRRAIKEGALQAKDFASIAYGVVEDSPATALAGLLVEVGSLTGGTVVALDILHMHFYRSEEDIREWDQALIDAAKVLLDRLDFTTSDVHDDFIIATVLKACCRGSFGEEIARNFSLKLYAALNAYQVSPHRFSQVFKALFEVQPFIALDVFLRSETTLQDNLTIETIFDFDTPMTEVGAPVLCEWASHDPTHRYPLLSQGIPMFGKNRTDESNEISPLFLEILEQAPNKYSFLGNFRARLYPTAWGGSLANILSKRRSQIVSFSESHYADVRTWAVDALPKIDRWIENERLHDREQEESFE